MWRPHRSVCPFVTWYQWLNHLSDFCAMQCRNNFFFYKICPTSMSFVVNYSVRHKYIATNTFHISWLETFSMVESIECRLAVVSLWKLVHWKHYLRAWQNFTHFFYIFGLIGLKFGTGDGHKNLLNGCECCKNCVYWGGKLIWYRISAYHEFHVN